MIVNQPNLKSLYTGFSTAFQGGFSGVEPQYSRIAMTVASTTAANEYGWLGDMPRIREWIGDRHVQSLTTHGYTLKNKRFELTVGVDRDNIEDDNIGIYSPMFSELGRSAATFPDELIFPLLKNGFSTPCYDGQYYFDTDHPVIDENGVSQSVSNSGGGAGTPWFLIDDTRAIKPIIYQLRKNFSTLVKKDREEDDNVFDRNEFKYGLNGRAAVGFSFWQLAYGSKQTLDATSYAAARAAMGTFKGDGGRLLGIRPTLLIVPPSLEGAALKLLNSEYASGGETNQWKGTAKLLVVPFLA